MQVDLCLHPKSFSATEIRALLPALHDLLRRHEARAAYLFGSVVRDTASRLSDLDIAVLPPAGQHNWFAYYNKLHEELCQLFHADNIDLVLLNQASLSLQARVVREGLRILDGNEASDLEERILARYADLSGWRRENWDMTRYLAQRGAMQEVNVVNPERVERFVFLIRDAVHELRLLNLPQMGLQAYRRDKRTRALSEHYLRIACEATLDLGRHLIVKTGLGVPQEYREVGKILEEQQIVPADLSEKIKAMAGLRNVLVHLYWDIDYALLYKIIVEDLDIFEQSIAHIFRYLDKLETVGKDR